VPGAFDQSASALALPWLVPSGMHPPPAPPRVREPLSLPPQLSRWNTDNSCAAR
jgi:hypothetical protein